MQGKTWVCPAEALPVPSLSCRPHARQGAAGPSSCFSQCGLGGRDEREPRPHQGSQAVQTLTHSCLEQRRGLPPPFLLRGGRVANGLRGRLEACQASREYGPAPHSSAGLWGPRRRRARAARSRPVPGRSFRGAEAGSSRRHLISGAWAGHLLTQNTWGLGLLGQWAEDTVVPGIATSACGPGGDRGAR